MVAQSFHRATFDVSREPRSAAYLSLKSFLEDLVPHSWGAVQIVARTLFDLYIILFGVEAGLFLYHDFFSGSRICVLSANFFPFIAAKLFDTFESGIDEMRRGAENAGTLPL